MTFSLKWLFGIVAFAGVSALALARASELVAATAFALSELALCIAVVFAAAGRYRSFCLAFAGVAFVALLGEPRSPLRPVFESLATPIAPKFNQPSPFNPKPVPPGAKVFNAKGVAPQAVFSASVPDLDYVYAFGRICNTILSVVLASIAGLVAQRLSRSG